MEKIRIKAEGIATKYNNTMILKKLWRECIVFIAMKKAAA
jgi:hypothetical protein